MSTTKKVSKKAVALNISGTPPSQVIVNATHYVTSMTGNAHFPNPSPALPAVSAQITALQAAYDLSLTRAKGSVGKMHLELKKLDILLKALAAYVESVANADPDNASIIIKLSGMTEKKPANRGPKIFSAKAGKTPGTALLNCKAQSRAVYVYQETTDPATATSWTTVYTGITAKFLKTGLISGTRYYFRYAVIIKGLQSDWSPVVNLVIQ
ncbi:MAG TPA: hypothetical protein VGO45_14575 [Bacteroidia bacterium]|jgi:hypothetical protein|nr:hypothetical protein [Bacteroidia bacterium]